MGLIQIHFLSESDLYSITVMLVFREGFWQFLQNSSKGSAVSQAAQFLSVILIVGQLIVSLRRALRQISFPSYGLSFHSRYVANVSFMTNAIGVIEDGYSKVLNSVYQCDIYALFCMLRCHSVQRRLFNS